MRLLTLLGEGNRSLGVRKCIDFYRANCPEYYLELDGFDDASRIQEAVVTHAEGAEPEDVPQPPMEESFLN